MSPQAKLRDCSPLCPSLLRGRCWRPIVACPRNGWAPFGWWATSATIGSINWSFRSTTTDLICNLRFRRMTSSLVETRHLTKRYAAVTALDDCNLRIARGEVFGLLGPNGSGKTTLLRLLMGFLRPSHGSAQIDGLDCYRRSVDVHRRVAYLPGDVRLFGNLRGSDVLQFFSRIRRGADLRRELDLAQRLGLETSRRVSKMSTGMRQKLALAVVMAVDSPLVILDEPT